MNCWMLKNSGVDAAPVHGVKVGIMASVYTGCLTGQTVKKSYFV